MLSIVKVLIIGIAVLSTTSLVQTTPIKTQDHLIPRDDTPPLGGQMDHLDQAGEAYGEYRLALAIDDYTQIPPQPPDGKSPLPEAKYLHE